MSPASLPSPTSTTAPPRPSLAPRRRRPFKACRLPRVAGFQVPDEWSQPGSNRRPLACHASALPAELWPLGRPSVAASGGGDLDRGDVAPELFQPVERPRLRGEDVQDDVEEVGDDPGRL